MPLSRSLGRVLTPMMGGAFLVLGCAKDPGAGEVAEGVVVGGRTVLVEEDDPGSHKERSSCGAPTKRGSLARCWPAAGPMTPRRPPPSPRHEHLVAVSDDERVEHRRLSAPPALRP